MTCALDGILGAATGFGIVSSIGRPKPIGALDFESCGEVPPCKRHWRSRGLLARSAVSHLWADYCVAEPKSKDRAEGILAFPGIYKATSHRKVRNMVHVGPPDGVHDRTHGPTGVSTLLKQAGYVGLNNAGSRGYPISNRRSNTPP